MTVQSEVATQESDQLVGMVSNQPSNHQPSNQVPDAQWVDTLTQMYAGRPYIVFVNSGAPVHPAMLFMIGPDVADLDL